MRVLRIALLASLLITSINAAAHSDGLASSENFIVYTPGQSSRAQENAYANLVVARAETFRKEFASQWLGEELADGAGPSIIYVDFSATEDRGLTWGKDHADRTHHIVWLTTSPQLATGCTLQHEIVHTVLATRYPHPNRLPEWVEEGIATRFDDAGRKEARRQLVADWLRSGVVPNLAGLLARDDIKSFDENSYAAAESLVSFLLTRGDNQTVLRFAEDGQSRGWDAALASHYGIESVGELQSQWNQWLVGHRAGG